MSAAVLEQRDSSRTLRAHRAKEKASEGTPRVIGGFEILARIGSGAMGTVFKARQQSMDRIVALKVLPPRIAKRDPVFVERLIREARASARLNHPHIVHGIDVGRDNATQLYYFAMEYVDGSSIRQLLDRDGVLPEARAVKIVAQVAQALECAHKAGIVHRDIKPDNILVAYNGAAKLADLGLAKHRLDLEHSSESSNGGFENDDSALTQAGRAVGTPYYMAPEQARGEDTAVDGRSDLYALGATLFHMISGRPPFKGTHAKETMRMRLTARAPDLRAFNPKASAGVARIVAKLLEREPSRRYQSPGELLAALECLDVTGISGGNGSAVAEEAGTGRAPTGAGTSGLKAGVRRGRRKARRPDERGGSMAMMLGGGALIAALIAGFLMMNGGSKPSAVLEAKQADEKSEASANTGKTEAPAKPAIPNDAKPQADQGKTAKIVARPKAVEDGPAVPATEVVEPRAPETESSSNLDSSHERTATVPVPAVVDPKLAAARKAQAELRTQFAPLVIGMRYDEALVKLSGAGADSSFDPVRAEIDAEAALVKSLRAASDHVAAGAKMLSDGRAFTLVRVDGRAQKVGKDAGWLVRGVADGKIQLSMAGADSEAVTSLKIEDLDTATRRALALLDTEGDVAASLPWTYAELLSLAVQDGPADAAVLHRLRGEVLAARGKADEAAPKALVLASWLERLQGRGPSVPAVPAENKLVTEPKPQQAVDEDTPPKPKLSPGNQAVEIEPPPEPPTGMEKEIEAEYLTGKLRRGAALAKNVAKSRLELDRGGLMFFDYETASKGYALMGQWLDGMTYADKALQKYKNNGEFLRVMAIGKFGLGNYAEAGTAFIAAERRASSLDKPWCRLMQIAALVHASPENAKRLVPGLAGDTQYLRADGFEPAVMRYFGGSLDEKQLMAEAKKVHKYYEQRERYCRACYFAGIKSLMDGKRDEAAAYFERCAQTDDGYLLEPLFAKKELEALK